MGKRKRGLDAESLNRELGEALRAADAPRTQKLLSKGASPNAMVSFVAQIQPGRFAGGEREILGWMPALAWCLDWSLRVQGELVDEAKSRALQDCATLLAEGGADCWEESCPGSEWHAISKTLKRPLERAAWGAQIALGRAILARMRANPPREAGAKKAQAALDAALAAAAASTQAGREEWMDWLLEEGANAFSTGCAKGGNALGRAAAKGNLRALEKLLAREPRAAGGAPEREAAAALAWLEAVNALREPTRFEVKSHFQEPIAELASKKAMRAINPARLASAPAASWIYAPYSLRSKDFGGEKAIAACARRLAMEVDLDKPLADFGCAELARAAKDRRGAMFGGIGSLIVPGAARGESKTLAEAGARRLGAEKMSNWRASVEAEKIRRAASEAASAAREADGGGRKAQEGENRARRL